MTARTFPHACRDDELPSCGALAGWMPWLPPLPKHEPVLGCIRRLYLDPTHEKAPTRRAVADPKDWER